MDSASAPPVPVPRLHPAPPPSPVYFMDLGSGTKLRSIAWKLPPGLPTSTAYSIINWPPSPECPYAHRAYIQNVYTAPEFRPRPRPASDGDDGGVVPRQAFGIRFAARG